jgi:hypothetical protein
MSPSFSTVSRPPWNEWHPALALRLAALALLALSLLACGPSFREARLTQPVSMSPMKDATVSVEAGRIFLTDDIVSNGMDDDSALAVELGITNGGRAPYTLSAASISCWLELSPDAPGETLSLTPAGGGEGDFPKGLSLEDQQLGSTTIPPGESRRYWVMFRGYRYPASDVPRKISVLLPDGRGRRVQVVIADPANGQLRWEMAPRRTGYMYGIQNTTLLASGMSVTAMAGNLSLVSRAGPILWDVGLSARMAVQLQGRLESPTSSFTGTGVNAHVTLPVAGWGAWQDPRSFGIYAGGEAQFLVALQPPPPEGEQPTPPRTYGTLAAEGGVELAIGSLRRTPTPFPISYTGPALPRWAIRLGYTHLFTGGLNSGGYTTTFRLAW